MAARKSCRRYLCVHFCLWRQRKGWLWVVLLSVAIVSITVGCIIYLGTQKTKDIFEALDKDGDKQLSPHEVEAGVKAGLLRASGSATDATAENRTNFLAPSHPLPNAAHFSSTPSQNSKNLLKKSREAPTSQVETQRPTPSVVPLDPNLRDGGIVPPVKLPDESTPIHLVISAFRDGLRCARTMGFALKKAKFPDRMHFRVMQATRKGDVSCADTFGKKELPNYCKELHPKHAERTKCIQGILQRVKIWTIPLEEGMGPAHQRGLLNERLDFEDPHAFCMTTDSHMDFRPNFDELVIGDWLGANNEFAVLATYPMAMMRGQDNAFARSHVDLCGYRLEAGIPRGQRGGNLPTRPGDKPYFTMNWAAGFSFHRCHADRNVPVDKNLKWIFTGEEVSRAVRFWTNGYDLYQPSRTDVYHDYSAAKQDFWQFGSNVHVSQENSRKRVRMLLKLGDFTEDDARQLEPFGLGKQRTVEQFVEWSLIDLGHPSWQRHLSSKGLKPRRDQYGEESEHNVCQKLERVPVADVQALRASVFSGGPPRSGDFPDPLTIEPAET